MLCRCLSKFVVIYNKEKKLCNLSWRNHLLLIRLKRGMCANKVTPTKAKDQSIYCKVVKKESLD